MMRRENGQRPVKPTLYPGVYIATSQFCANGANYYAICRQSRVSGSEVFMRILFADIATRNQTCLSVNRSKALWHRYCKLVDRIS